MTIFGFHPETIVFVAVFLAASAYVLSILACGYPQAWGVLARQRTPSLTLIRIVGVTFTLTAIAALFSDLLLWIFDQPAEWERWVSSAILAAICLHRIQKWDNERIEHAEYLALVQEVQRTCRLDIRMGEGNQ